MLTLTTIVTEDPPLRELSQRGIGRAMTAAHKAQGQRWQSEMFPRHFTPAARIRYDHAPRSQRTKDRKRRQGKPDIDHVDSGLAKSIALSPRPVVATRTKARIRMPGPSYYTFRPRGRINLAREITRVVPAEQRKLERTGGKQFEKSIRAESGRAPKRKTIQ